LFEARGGDHPQFHIDARQRFYLETDFIVAALERREFNHERCRVFVERLARGTHEAGFVLVLVD
jgi:hypothetical protein